jgi:hypothetical protein
VLLEFDRWKWWGKKKDEKEEAEQLTAGDEAVVESPDTEKSDE